MTFTRLKEDYDATAGMSLRGFVLVGFEELVEVFGQPDDGCDEKTRVEWRLRFEDGTVATVYDYYASRPVKELGYWHVGGLPGSAALLRVAEALDITHLQVSEGVGS